VAPTAAASLLSVDNTISGQSSAKSSFKTFLVSERKRWEYFIKSPNKITVSGFKRPIALLRANAKAVPIAAPGNAADKKFTAGLDVIVINNHLEPAIKPDDAINPLATPTAAPVKSAGVKNFLRNLSLLDVVFLIWNHL